MSTHSSHIPTSEIGNDTYESIDDFFDKYIKEVSIFKTFSNSSLDSLKQEAKKLEKRLSIKHQEALNRAALNRGFKSFKDCKSQFNYWKSLSSVYIYISNGTTLSYTKSVFSRSPQDGKSKSMKELMDSTSINRVKVYEPFSENSSLTSESVSKTSSVAINENESISKKNVPISELDNHKLGIKLLNESEKEDFFISHRDLCSKNRINREKAYIFKFIHYKLDPVEEKKIREDIEESIKKDGYRFYETNATYQIANLIDEQFYALLNTETYTEDSYVDESYSISPSGYIANNTYYNAVDLHDDIFDQFAPIVDSDY